jgi:hypothetical protein
MKIPLPSSGRVIALAVSFVVLSSPVFAQAQATLSGAVSDAQGGALPGAVVVAVHPANGIDPRSDDRD